jgi:hypothetical protein
METPDLILIPATPLSPTHPRPTAPSASTSSLAQSAGSYRTSSEDTAVTIFSMYSDSRDNWAASAKVLALNDVEPVARSRRPSSESAGSSTWRGPPENARRYSTRPHSANGKRPGKPPSSFQNGHAAPAEAIDHRHSIAGSCYRTSEESVSLPYTRYSLPPAVDPPPLPSKSPSRPVSRPSQTPPHELAKPLRPPLADPSGSTPNHSFTSQPSEGEDPDSYHVRSTYAQLDVSGVRGDGYEEGVELTRAKQGGTTYLMSQPHDRGRGSASDLSPKELAVLASVDRCVTCSRLGLSLTHPPQIRLPSRTVGGERPAAAAPLHIPPQTALCRPLLVSLLRFPNTAPTRVRPTHRALERRPPKGAQPDGQVGADARVGLAQRQRKRARVARRPAQGAQAPGARVQGHPGRVAGGRVGAADRAVRRRDARVLGQPRAAVSGERLVIVPCMRLTDASVGRCCRTRSRSRRATTSRSTWTSRARSRDTSCSGRGTAWGSAPSSTSCTRFRSSARTAGTSRAWGPSPRPSCAITSRRRSMPFSCTPGVGGCHWFTTCT